MSLYPATSHVLRTTFSGGVTTNGIASIMPGNRNVFRLETPGSGELTYLGLADLGQNTGDSVETAYDYVQVLLSRYTLHLCTYLYPRMVTIMWTSAWT